MKQLKLALAFVLVTTLLLGSATVAFADSGSATAKGLDENVTVTVTVEDGVISGGLGSAVLEFFADHGYDVEVKRIGIPDRFVMHGTIAELRRLCGMDAESIAETLRMA